jgi:sortase A
MIGKTFYLPVKEEIRYFIERKIQKKYIVSDRLSVISYQEKKVEKGLLAKALNIKSIEILVPQDPNFSILIPKIAANARILANVDPANEKEYLAALREGVAHAAGTAYPTEGGHIFLFAHSTDYFWNVGTYNAVFYLLNKLEKGDEVDLFYRGYRVVYKVIDKRIVDPSQVEFLTRKTNREFLTLQTCWPPGTTLKRLLVFAKRMAE